VSYAHSVAAKKRWAKPGAREAQSEKIVEAMRNVPPREAPRGRAYGKRCGITVYIDPAMLASLTTVAKKQRKSVAELIRTYIEWGLETDGEAK